MRRITREDLRGLVRYLADQGYSVQIEWAGDPARPRLYSLDNHEISPRLSMREMELFLDAFKAGIHAAETRQHVRDAENGN